MLLITVSWKKDKDKKGKDACLPFFCVIKVLTRPIFAVCYFMRNYLEEKIEMYSDYVFKNLRSEETSEHVVITKQSRAKLRKRCELYLRRKRILANT